MIGIILVATILFGMVMIALDYYRVDKGTAKPFNAFGISAVVLSVVAFLTLTAMMTG